MIGLTDKRWTKRKENTEKERSIRLQVLILIYIWTLEMREFRKCLNILLFQEKNILNEIKRNYRTLVELN